MKCKKMFVKLFELQCHHIFGIFPSLTKYLTLQLTLYFGVHTFQLYTQDPTF